MVNFCLESYTHPQHWLRFSCFGLLELKIHLSRIEHREFGFGKSTIILGRHFAIILLKKCIINVSYRYILEVFNSHGGHALAILLVCASYAVRWEGDIFWWYASNLHCTNIQVNWDW